MEEKNDFREYGKLGGRPKKEIKKERKRVNLSFSIEEYKKLEKRAEKHNMKLTEYCYKLISEKELPNYEENKVLIQYGSNFSRISNYMKRGVFNQMEKDRLIKEIEEVISGIKKTMNW